MGRLIEIDDPAACPSPLRIDRGDVVLLRAGGALLRPGDVAVEVLGPFTTALVGGDGAMVEAAGLPHTVLLLARGPGLARVAVVDGSFPAPRTTELRIDVRA